MGIEISESASNYARDKFKLEVITTTLEEAHFPKERFDVISMWDVIEHLPSPAETVAECHRILKPGGLLLIHTPNQGSLIHFLYHILYTAKYRRIAALTRGIYGPGGHMFFFNKATLKRLLGKVGFDIVLCGDDSVWLEGRYLVNKLGAFAISLVDILGGLINRRYRMTLIARKNFPCVEPTFR